MADSTNKGKPQLTIQTNKRKPQLTHKDDIKTPITVSIERDREKGKKKEKERKEIEGLKGKLPPAFQGLCSARPSN